MLFAELLFTYVWYVFWIKKYMRKSKQEVIEHICTITCQNLVSSQYWTA